MLGNTSTLYLIRDVNIFALSRFLVSFDPLFHEDITADFFYTEEMTSDMIEINQVHMELLSSLHYWTRVTTHSAVPASEYTLVGLFQNIRSTN